MKQLKTKRRRLFFDIETSHNLGIFFRAGFKQFIDYHNIIKERGIICICYKWEDEKEVYSLQWDSKQNDKKMIEQFIEVMNTADELVGHNVDRFDLPWVRTRALIHGVKGMLPNYTTLDTLKMARSKFALQSNKLDYLAQILGLGGKIKTEQGWWVKILLDKDKDAMAKMVKYCKKDVTLLEDVFVELKGHIEPKTHYGVLFGGLRANCPECGSDDIIKSKKRTTATGLVKVQCQCKTCGRYHTRTDK